MKTDLVLRIHYPKVIFKKWAFLHILQQSTGLNIQKKNSLFQRNYNNGTHLDVTIDNADNAVILCYIHGGNFIIPVIHKPIFLLLYNSSCKTCLIVCTIEPHYAQLVGYPRWGLTINQVCFLLTTGQQVVQRT